MNLCAFPISAAPVKLRLVSAVLLDLVCVAKQCSLKVPADEDVTQTCDSDWSETERAAHVLNELKNTVKFPVVSLDQLFLPQIDGQVLRRQVVFLNYLVVTVAVIELNCFKLLLCFEWIESNET